MSTLDALTIASPCTQDWGAMTGDDRVRHCRACRLDVFDVSALTHDEALALIASATGRDARVCLRLHRRADGTVVTADCLTAAARLRRRVAWAAAAVAGFLGLGSAVLAGSAAESGGLGSWRTWERAPFRPLARALPAAWVPQQPAPMVEMGDICVPIVEPAETE